MSLILVDDSSKGNLCCSKSIDLERGCKNKCIGCYGTKTSLMGAEKYFNQIIPKEYNENKFRTSVKNTIKKGYTFARLGKHSDAANIEDYDILKSVLKISGEEGLRLIFVSKSLKFDQQICDLLVKYNHVLHISLGMISEAQSNNDRRYVGVQYRARGVNLFYRITEDISKPMADIYWALDWDKCIVTPMRFTSKDVAEEYGCDLKKYHFINGYYKVLKQYINHDWENFKYWCGEVVNVENNFEAEMLCCDCGVFNG